MAKWASRGCNCAFGFNDEGGVTSYATWKASCIAHGMKYVVQWREPFRTHNQGAGPLTHADDSDPNLLGVLLPDEPDGAANFSPGQCLDLYNAAKTMLPSKPVYLNFDGHLLLPAGRPIGDYRCYMDGADVGGFDYYPINRCNGPTDIPTIGRIIDIMQYAGSMVGQPKQYFCCLECSNQDLGKQSWLAAKAAAGLCRGPTAAEMGLEVNQVIARPNMIGVVWFPEGIGASFETEDAMTPDTIAAMTALNQMLVTR